MEMKPLEIYSEESNYAIVRMPGRNLPGCVVQGDSLAILCRSAKRIAARIKEKGIDDEELLGEVEDLNNSLLDRLLHYQQVLQQHGLNLPYYPAASKEDFVRLLPESQNDP